MTYRVVRTSSPPRIQLDAPKSSSGTVLSSIYDVRYTAQPQPTSTGIPVPRDPRRNSAFETIPVSKSTYSDATKPGATVSRTEYSVKPRRESTAAETRRPLSLVVRNVSPARNRSSIESARDASTYSATKQEQNKFLQPRPHHHHGSHKRHTSATPAELHPNYTYALTPSSGSSRAAREYHKRGPSAAEASAGRSGLSRVSENDLQYEYTGPREQFARDYPSRSKRRGSTSRNEQTYTSQDVEFRSLPSRRDTVPAVKELDEVDEGGRYKPRESRSEFESDPDRRREERKSRAHHARPVLHQDSGYTSSRDDYDRRRTQIADSRPVEAMALVTKGHYRDVDRREVQEQAPRKQRVYDRDEHTDYGGRYDSESRRPRKYRTERRNRGMASDYERQGERHRDRDYEQVTEEERDKNREKVRRTEPDPVRESEYSNQREHDRRDRISRPERSEKKLRSRDSSPEISSIRKAAGAVAAGSLAAAALGAASKSSRVDSGSEYDTDEWRRRRHRPRHAEEDDDQREIQRERSGYSQRQHKGRRHDHKEDDSDTETQQDVGRVRPRSRSRDRRRAETTQTVDESRDKQRYPPAISEEADRRSSVTSDAGPSVTGRESGHELERSDALASRDRALSPGEDNDDRPRKVTLVEPPNPKEVILPKGILKKPREIPFPEDPNPTREGVAPLNNAGKGGVPPGARWTKINRMIVNPEALEKANERFEVREEYVIVLRVLAREEIEKLAESTRKIRGEHDQVTELKYY